MAQKKSLTHRHVCFSEPGGPVDRITAQLLEVTAAHFDRRLTAIRKAVEGQPAETAQRNLLELAARWTPDGLATQLRLAMELAALEGSEAVWAEADEDGAPAYAAPRIERQEFKEQIDFLTQKRPRRTKVWTDAMHGDHDRAFVVAGVTDIAMLEEFQAAIIDGARTYDRDAFAAEFDRLVAKYGWSYNGGRDWRIRTIFETNIRTSHMAGRLKQMRDPDMVKLRPYWQYVHAETREPLRPRPQHVAWDGLALMWNDPWWNTHFPPNDWLCSCGVRTLSERQLKRLGKTGPDKAPPDKFKIGRARDGEPLILPDGIGRGWDYMPGDMWERGLVPSALIEEGGGLIHEGRHVVRIDEPEPIETLIAAARPIRAEKMEEGLREEDYINAFLEPFGARIGRAVLWQDAAGHRIPISEQFFRDRDGEFKVLKRGRAPYARMMAETIMDPDEIWIGVARKRDPISGEVTDLIFDRRYIRAGLIVGDDGTMTEAGFVGVLEIGRRWWEDTTAYPLQDNKGRPVIARLGHRRGGKLLWKRK